MRKTLTWLALAAAVAYLAYLALREEQTLIASATASPRDLQQTYSEEGRTRLKNRYHIHAPVSGTLRRITLHHEASRLVGQVMLDLLDKNGIEFEAAGGLTMGADPVGTAIMRAAGDQDRAIDAFVVRKAQKSYGMGRQVEGPSVEGRRVVAVEDTSTTGGSALTAVEALRKAGAEVVAVAVIVDRATGAKEHVEEVAGVPCLYAYSKDELGLD